MLYTTHVAWHYDLEFRLYYILTPTRTLSIFFQFFYQDHSFLLVFFFFFLMIRPPPRSPLFPYTTLFRSLQLARHEQHPARRLAGRYVRPVLRRDLERQVRARARARLHEARPVLNDGVPRPTAVAAHVVLDHRVRPRGLVGPEPTRHRLERLFYRRHRFLLFVGFTVGAPSRPTFSHSKRKEVHSAGHGQDGAGDVTRALRAEEGDGARHVLGFSLPLHRDPLDHPLVEGAELRVGRDDPGRDRVAGDVVTGALEGDRLGEPDQPDLARRVGGLAEAAHEAGDRRHADDPPPVPLAHTRKHRLRHLVRPGHVHGQIELPVLVLHVLELGHRVD